MSDAKKTEEEDAAAPAPAKSKSKLLIMIGAGVVVLALVAGGVIYMMMGKKAPADGEEEEEVAEETTPHHKGGKLEPPVFVKLDTFTVRLQNEGSDSYLQAIVELRVLDLQIAEQVKQFNPEIRHKSLLVMAAKTPAELNTPAGVEALAVELRKTINSVLSPSSPKKKSRKKEVAAENRDLASPSDPVQAVLFTSFIVQ